MFTEILNLLTEIIDLFGIKQENGNTLIVEGIKYKIEMPYLSPTELRLIVRGLEIDAYLYLNNPKPFVDMLYALIRKKHAKLLNEFYSLPRIVSEIESEGKIIINFENNIAELTLNGAENVSSSIRYNFEFTESMKTATYNYAKKLLNVCAIKTQNYDEYSYNGILINLYTDKFVETTRIYNGPRFMEQKKAMFYTNFKPANYFTFAKNI
jgi:hypothetical protein